MDKKQQTRKILKELKKEYKKTGPFIEWSTPLELLVGTILSAQCTDERVNAVTQKLFKKYTTAGDYAKASINTLEKEVYSTGFYKNKAKALKESGQIMVDHFDGEVPDTLEGLLKLRGVSIKTAYLVLSKVYGKNVGLAVDTHVFRLSKRIGLSDAKTPEKMSKELSEIVDKKNYLLWNEYLITHGRAVCGRKPKCDTCVINELCKKNI
ncbi:MAG: endonuclease III [Candidatus Moraniibacteriota bacterium]|nr:MAG: endonuclease III [Candidatus Moranbacteria bacterium]